jgi:hypothetical protein
MLYIRGSLEDVFGGVEDFLPKVYVEYTNIEFNRLYNASLRVRISKPPKTRPESSLVAHYMLLYLLPSTDKPTVKLGSCSAYGEVAAMMWAQAPLYARVIGVFHLKKEVHLEELEYKSLEILQQKASKYMELFDFKHGKPSINDIVHMWLNLENFYDTLNFYIEKLAEVSKILFQELARVEYIDAIYDDCAWLSPPKLKPEIPIQFRSLRDIMNTASRAQLTRRRPKRALHRGLFKVTPIGICMFTTSRREQGSNSMEQVEDHYVDVCREFVYNVDITINVGG